LGGAGQTGALTATNAIGKERVMYTLIRSIPVRQLLLEQVPALGLSFIIAELFYKFHSFTLECLAFLGTWYVIDVAITRVSGLFVKDTHV
jgi:hypothetical protein